MDNNVTSLAPIYKLIRQNNANQFPNIQGLLSQFSPKKVLNYLAIQPDQEIDIVMFCILLVRYTSLLIVCLYIGDSINLI